MRPDSVTLAPPVVGWTDRGDSQRLFCGEWPGGEPSLVFVHGLSGQHRQAAGLGAALAGRLQLLAMDLRGRGLSGF